MGVAAHSRQDFERRFSIVTYGCQMNVHDSERLSNLLYHGGFTEVADGRPGGGMPPDAAREADLLIINTCSIRDKAENHLYSDLGRLREWKAARPGRVLGVGGCVAQHVGDALLKRFEHLDFVFGTHNLKLVPAMAAAALRGERSSEVAWVESEDRFDLPAPHAEVASRRPGRAFVTVMEGCDMFCSFCIVPTTRGREISRRAEAVVEEVRRLAEQGVREITLLGQTVNAYGRHDARRGHSAAAGTVAFAELLARLDAISGIDRIRYTSPHPLFFDEALIQAHRDLGSLCPHVHLPVQSGSSAVLERMRRRYSREDYLDIVERLRAARPDLAITTDVIVGFPGETEWDFEQTLSLMRAARFADSYSFKYSARPGTAAAELGDRVPAADAQHRLAALQGTQRSLTLDHHRSRVGSRTAILVEGESRRGGQVSGRDPYHRLVNVGGVGNTTAPGELLDVEIVEATPHSLIGEALPKAGAGGEMRGPAVKGKTRSAEERRRSAASVASSGEDRGEDPLRVL